MCYNCNDVSSPKKTNSFIPENKSSSLKVIKSNKYSEEDKIKAVNLFQSGNLSIRKIAKEIGCCDLTVSNWLEKIGLYERSKTKSIKWDLEKIHNHLIENQIEGKLVSSFYKNMHTPLIWKCNNPDHDPFPATWNSVYRGSWCSDCYDERRGLASRKYDLEYLNNLANERSGRCLSTEYLSGKNEYECKHGHKFYLTVYEIEKLNRWCSICKPFKNEEITRQILNRILNTNFVKTTFAKIGIKEGGRIELDGYCANLNIAFEYNGDYHTKDKNSPKYRPSILKNDEVKKIICKNYGIKLVIIPEYKKNKNFNYWDQIEFHLKEYEITWNSYSREINWDPVLYKQYTDEIRDIVESKGGTLLTKYVLDATTKLDVLCDEGHLFHPTAQKLKQGQWCRHNMKNRKLTDDEIRLTIEDAGGELLEIFTKVNKQSKKVRWVKCMCEEGHIFTRRLGDIRSGRWCYNKNHKGAKKIPKNDIRSDKFAA